MSSGRRHPLKFSNIPSSLSSEQPDPSRDDALVESELRLRRLIEHALDAVVTIDESGNILEWNEEAERTFGWVRAEAIGENAIELLVPERLRDRAREILAAGNAEALNRRVEAIALRRDGSQIPVELSVTPLFWRSRRIYTLFARDISDQTRAAATARHFEAVIDASSNAVIGLGLDGTILSWNRAAERMFGYHSDAILGTPVTRLLLPEQAVEIRDKVRWGIEEDTRTRAVRRDGSLFRILRALRPINAEGQPIGAVLICNDLSANEELEHKLTNEEYFASLGRVASTVGYEFNNVLMAIEPFIDVIERQTTDPRLKEAAAHMRRSVQRGSQITDQMRAFSLASMPMPLALVQARTLMASIEQELHDLIKPEIEFVVESDPGDFAIVCHLAQLTQAVAILVLNAQDSLGRGRVTLRMAIIAHDAVEISVTDHGQGMSDEAVRRVFDPLFTSREKGTGLGLSVARYIVDRHGGSIDVSSKVGEGTVFRIRLRAVAPAP